METYAAPKPMQTSSLPRVHWRAIALLTLGFCWHGIAAAAAGYIQTVVGKAAVWDRTSERPAQKGIQLYEGDAVVTGPSSTVQIRMEDDTLIFVYENSRLKIDQYIFSPGAQKNKGSKDNAVLQLVKGGLRIVTGLISKKNKDVFAVTTPNATIGIRGTDFDTVFVEASSSVNPAAAGTYNRVYSGSTTLKSASGLVNVAENEAAFASLKPGDKPERLKEIPEFMRKLEKVSAPPAVPPPPEQEVVTLRYRTAEELLPLLKPQMNATTAISGQGKKLVLAAPESKRSELKAAIAALDTPLRRMQITVRFDNPAAPRVAVSSRSRSIEPIEQRLQVSEGQRAFFYDSQAQVPEKLLVKTGALLVLLNPQSPAQSQDGLEIVPRFVGDRVSMEFYTRQSSAAGEKNPSLRTQRIGNTVSAKPGEWIEAGGGIYGGATAGGVTAANIDVQGNNRLLFLRADEVK